MGGAAYALQGALNFFTSGAPLVAVERLEGLRVCEKMGQARSLMLFIQGFLDIDDEPVPFFHKLSLVVVNLEEPGRPKRTIMTGNRKRNRFSSAFSMLGDVC